MDLKSLLDANVEYNTWKEDIDAQAKARRQELVVLNQELDLVEFEALDYDEAKAIYDAIWLNLEYNTQRPKVSAVLDRMKARKYPNYNLAHLYPVINEIEGLTDAQKHDVDQTVFKFKDGYIMPDSSAWYKLGFSTEFTNKVLGWLYEKGVTSKFYRIHCECGEESEIMSDELFEKHKHYFDLVAKATTEQGITDDDYAWIETFDENERMWEVGCGDCEGRQIEGMKDIECASVVYRVTMTPDYTLASK